MDYSDMDDLRRLVDGVPLPTENPFLLQKILAHLESAEEHAEDLKEVGAEDRDYEIARMLRPICGELEALLKKIEDILEDLE